MTDQLSVLLRGKHVADLERATDGTMKLTYSDAATTDADFLSLSLPVRLEPYSDSDCRGVLDWLLPEKQVRANIAQRIPADPTDTFALLAEYGQECAGAVQFIDIAADVVEPSIHWLTDAELARRINQLATHPFLSLDEDDVELSLGGVQEKALVIVSGNRIGLPRHGAVSTHILKPDISDRIRSVLAEGLALGIARTLGVDTAGSAVRRVGERLVLFVERFDRVTVGGGVEPVVRVHHETMAQALDVAPLAKYEVRGGPGIDQLARVVRSHSTDVVRDLRALSRLIVLNTLLGNADAHVGNYGLLHHGASRGTRLSPAYDLVPVASILGTAPKGYAMRIGGEFTFGKLTDERMLELGRQLGVAPRSMVVLRDELRAGFSEATQQSAAELRNGCTLTEPEHEELELLAASLPIT